MVYVYLLYGLAFVSLGLIVAVYPKQRNALRLSRHLPLLALFGVLHGATEWVDLARHLEGDLAGLVLARSLLLASSMFLLALFGARAFGAGLRSERTLRALPWGLLVVFLIVVVAARANYIVVASAARYLFGVVGSTLAALAFVRERGRVAAYGDAVVQQRLWPAVAGFAGYGLFAGVVGPPGDMFPANVVNAVSFHDLVGVPIQVFRTLAACVVTFAVISLLSVFRWEQERRLASSEERYRGLVQLAPLGIMIVDSGRVSLANRRAAEIIGAGSVAELEGRAMLDLVGASSRERVARLVGELTLGQAATVADDELIRRADGTEVQVLLAAAPLLVGDERALQVVFQDITRLKQQEAEIARHRDELDARVRERTADLEAALGELKQALSEVKTLSGMLPVCAWCRRIRDDDGYWEQLESYVSSHSDAQFTHGICPDCSHKIKRRGVGKAEEG